MSTDDLHQVLLLSLENMDKLNDPRVGRLMFDSISLQDHF